MEISISKKDVIWNFIGTFFLLGINFLLIPILIFFLTDELLGLWQVYTSLGSIALLLDFGFSPTLARNIAYIYSGAKTLKKSGVQKIYDQNINYSLLASIIQICKYIYLIIAIFATITLLIIGTKYVIGISRNISGSYYLIAWFIYVTAIFFNLFYYYYSAALLGIGAIKENNKARTFGCILQIIVCLILSIFNFNIIAPAIAYLVYGLAYRGLAKKYFYDYNNLGKKIIEAKKMFSFDKFKEIFMIIWHNAWRDGIVAISNYLISQANTIICSLYFTLSETAIYSISLQFVTAIGIISSVIFNAYQPKLQSACVNDDKSIMQNIMALSILSYDLLYCLGIIILIFCGLPILKIINSNYNFEPLLIMALGIHMFLQKRYALFTSYYSSTNRLPYVKAFIISGILSILFSLLLCIFSYLGIWGLFWGQFFAQLIYNDWFWPLKAKNELDIKGVNILYHVVYLKTFIKKRETL